jgi:hypothetical protein
MPGIGKAVIELAAIRDSSLATRSPTITADIGTYPDVSPLASVIISGAQTHCLTGKPLARAPKAGNHLIAINRMSCRRQISWIWCKIACRRNNHAASALNRLGNKGGDVRRRRLRYLVFKPGCRIGGKFGLVLITLI